MSNLMYEVVEVQSTYSVLEINTNQFVAKGLSLQEANMLNDKLNSGSGFYGNTPSFLVEGENNA